MERRVAGIRDGGVPRNCPAPPVTERPPMLTIGKGGPKVPGAARATVYLCHCAKRRPRGLPEVPVPGGEVGACAQEAPNTAAAAAAAIRGGDQGARAVLPAALEFDTATVP